MRGRLGILGAGCLLLNGCAGLSASSFNPPSLPGYTGLTKFMQKASPGDFMQRAALSLSKGFHPFELCKVVNPGTVPGSLCE